MSQFNQNPKRKQRNDEPMINNNVANAEQPMDTDPPANDPLDTFYCCCRECRLYFNKGCPIKCINPCIAEMRCPKCHLPNNNGADAKPPVFRRPADPDDEKDHKVKRRKH